MEVALVWSIVLSFIIVLVHLIHRIVEWRIAVSDSNSNNYAGHSQKYADEEAAAAKAVVKALVLVPAALTGPVFLLGVLVFLCSLFVKALQGSMNTNK